MAFPSNDQTIDCDSTMAFPTRDQFLASYLRQYFSLPDSMIYYILKNPHSLKIYQKLIQCCKYFFIKNPILVFHCLKIDDDGWKICAHESINCKPSDVNLSIDLTDGCKIWIEERLHIVSSSSNDASDFIGSSLYQCDAKKLQFENQHITLPQFLSYSQHAQHVSLTRVAINSGVDSGMPLEEIIANLPNIERFFIEFENASKSVSSDTVAKLLQIPHFKNIIEFSLENISEEFDIDAFYKYYKNSNNKISFYLNYYNPMSEEYIEKLELINWEILETGYSGWLTSAILYPELIEEEYKALCELYEESLQLHR